VYNLKANQEETKLLKHMPARHQWLTPVILAIREAEIKRIAVQTSPGK
jgi:hypothetical protein